MQFDEEKLRIAKNAVKENNVDLWIIAARNTDIHAEPVLDVMGDITFHGLTALLVTPERLILLVPQTDADNFQESALIEKHPYTNSFTDELAGMIKNIAPDTIALDYSTTNPASDGLSWSTETLIRAAVSKQATIVSAMPIVNLVKGIKTSRELACMRHACAVTEEIFVAARSFIQPGINCKDIYAFFQSEVAKRGVGWSWPKAENPGVFSGYGCPNGHMGAPDFPVKAGDVVNVDFGIVVDGYGSDMQRMYYLLKPGETEAPEEVRRAFAIVRDSIQMTADFLRPGVTGNEADTLCRTNILTFNGEDYGWATGHQIGRVAHDGGPLLGPRKPRYNFPELIDTPLREGNCFTLEPGVNTSRGHVQLEEDVVIRGDHAEFLSTPQQEIWLIQSEEH